MNKISKINAICLVVQSFNVKLTLNQKYIFQSVMNLFGKNVPKILLLCLLLQMEEKSKLLILF